MSYGRTPCYIYASSWRGEPLNVFVFNRLNGSEALERGMDRSAVVAEDEIAQLVFSLHKRGELQSMIKKGEDL